MLFLKSIPALVYTVSSHFLSNHPEVHFYLLLDIGLFFSPFVNYLWITISASEMFGLDDIFSIKEQSLRMNSTQPWATPCISRFRIFLTLIQKQGVDYFALYTPVQYCSILFEMWSSKKKEIGCVWQMSLSCPSLVPKLFRGLCMSAWCLWPGHHSELGILNNLWARRMLPVPAAPQLILSTRHAQMLLYQQ